MFEISQEVGTNSSDSDGEIAAIRVATEELDNYHTATATKWAVFFIDFQAAITAIADNSPAD